MKSSDNLVSCGEEETGLVAEGFIQKVLSASGTFYCSRVQYFRQYAEHNHNKTRDFIDDSFCIGQYRVIMCSSAVDCMEYEFSRVNFAAATFLLVVLPPKEPLPLPQRNGYYLIVDAFETLKEARNLIDYLKTRFVYHLVSWRCIKGLDKTIFTRVPVLNFNEKWTGSKLYAKYGLSENEIAFVNSKIRPMKA